MVNSIRLVFVLLIFLSACGYRFAQITKNLCDHPKEDRHEWGVYAQIRAWSTYKDVKTIIISNPLHWHIFSRGAIHKKCCRCGQKFCSVWTRKKWLHKIK